jgi:hypothetical protein
MSRYKPRDKTKPHATKEEDVSETYGQPAWRYSDGSIRGERGHMITPLPGVMPITTERAVTMHQLNKDKKYEVMRKAANNAVQRGDMRAEYGDWAFLAEITNAAQAKATNIDDPKQIDAARFIVQELGIAERTNITPLDAYAQQSNPLLAEALANITRALLRASGDVVEGHVIHPIPALVGADSTKDDE